MTGSLALFASGAAHASEGDPNTLWLRLFVAALLILLNGFFVMVEFAIVKVRQTRLMELREGDRPKLAERALAITHDLDNYLSATQLGITLASLGLGWIGEPAMAQLLEPIFVHANLGPTAQTTISFALAFGSITFLHVVVGELMPKSMAIVRPEQVSMYTALPMQAFYKLFFPALRILAWTSRVLLLRLGIDPASAEDSAHSEEELRMLLATSKGAGFISEHEVQLVENVFDFSERTAREVMIPRADVVYLDIQKPQDENLKTVGRYGHTRYPLCDGSLDKPIGVIHIKDLVIHMLTEETPIPDLRDLSRKLPLVTAGMPVDELLAMQRGQRAMMVGILDEFGGLEGIISLEMLVEEIIGEIDDEFDQPEVGLRQLIDGSYQVDGSLPISEINDSLGLELSDAQYTTIGGFVLNRIGRSPELGDTVEDSGFTITVIEVDGHRPTRLEFKGALIDQHLERADGEPPVGDGSASLP